VSRVLAVDWGRRRLGLAVSDPSGLLARPLPTAEIRNPRDAVDQVARVARAEEAETIVVGLPVHLSGDEGGAARAARRLGESLRGLGFAVAYHDERLTSEEALDVLRSRGEKHPPRERVDQMAALLILQAYLDGRPRDA
jgi:putative Holliday junction resolvase